MYQCRTILRLYCWGHRAEHLLVDGSGVFTKGNENVHCQSSKKDVICAAGNEDFGKQALDGGEEKTFCSSVQAAAISGTFLEVVGDAG